MSRKKLEEHVDLEPIVKGWSDKRYKSFITSLLRSGFRRFPNKYEVLKASYIGKKVNLATGRIAMHYKCASCKGEFPAKEVQVDHINPIVDPFYGFINWDSFIKRLFCSVNNLQVLCKPCHKIKTDKENNKRKK